MPCRIRCLLVAALLLAVAPLPIRAQSAPDTTDQAPELLSYTMEPVEVTAAPFELTTTTAPLAISSIARSDDTLNRTGSLSIESIAAGIPGLWVNNRDNYALGEQITMRGLGWRAQFGVRGLQVLLDGIPLTLADGQSTLDIVDPAFIRRVEAIRGPASTFWGNSAGGVLAFSTRPPTRAQHTVRLRQLAGSYGLTKTELQVTPDLGPHRFSVFTSYQAQDGYRAHNAVRISRTGLTGTIRLSEQSGLRLFGAYVNKPKAQTPGSLSQEAVAADRDQAREAFVNTDAGEQSEQGQLGAAYYRDLGVGTLRATGYGVLRTLDNPLPFAYIILDRRAGGGRLTFQDEASAVEWGVGVETKYQRDDRAEFTNDGGVRSDPVQVDQLETVSTVGTFGRMSVPLGPLWLHAGLRYDRLRFEADNTLNPPQSGSRTFHAWSPSVGLLYPFSTGRAYLNWSTALEAPTTSELSNRPDGTGFNPNLEPEHTTGLEAGVRGAAPSAHLSYDVALFALQVRDLLLPFQLDDGGPTYFRNEGKTRHLGAEAALQWRGPHNLSLAASYTLTHAEFIDARTLGGTALDGNAIPGVPRHRARGSVEWQPAPWALAIEFEGANAFDVNSLNTAENEGYVVTDLRLSHNGFTLADDFILQPFAAVNNALDVEYNGSFVVNAFGGRYYEPAPGRTWQAGLTLQFN